MTPMVHSYLAGAWVSADDPGRPIVDPTTGDEVARVSGAGLDDETTAAVLHHAREVGGPALRALTFHQRARMLQDLADALLPRVGEIYQHYATSGGTPADARIDVEGGIAVLPVYARRALRELPDDTVLPDGDARPLLGNRGFVGQTVLSSRPGLLLAVNAFNFPIWGMLEKLAPALLAGLPVIVKPATPTAHLTEIAVRHIVDADILPAGALQLLAGGSATVTALLEHLGGHDHVAFTGSATTAATLRAHPAFVERGAHLNAEADSLNASILGPDAGPGTAEFDLFVAGVVREMTNKCGQKCTAIRRALVPTPLLDPVVEAVRKRLDTVVVGDPRDEDTTMGPLVSADQRADVIAAMRRIMVAARVAVGGPDAPAGPGVPDGVPHGYAAPTLLVATDRRHRAVHTVEAFGPVATVIGYDSAAEAAELTALGEGSLVASVVSHDPDFVREVVRAIAPHHGRVLVLDRDIARGSTPHGAVLPQLIHGGPGRAGGGEELGGIRGVTRLMQATSLASSASMSTAVSGVWNPAATQRSPARHPFRLHLEDLRVGDTLHTGSRQVTIEDIEAFAALTGDTFYAHMDQAAAAASPLFEGRVAHGYYVLSLAAGLFVDPAPGPVLANVGLADLRFRQPVYPGDVLTVRLTVKRIVPRPDEGRGEVAWDVEVSNADGEAVATYELHTLNASRHGVVEAAG